MRIGYEIKILSNLIDREIRSSAAIDAMDKMTNMHGRIIGFLHRNEDKEIFQRDIEKSFMISGPSVSEILKLMEKNGLVERRGVEKDGRLKRITLTDKARLMDSEVQTSLDEVEKNLASMLSGEEYAMFEIIVYKLIESLKEKHVKEIV